MGPPPPKAGSARTGPLPLHPMSLGDILDGAFKLFKANAGTILLIALVFTGPLQLIAAFVQRSSLRAFDLLRDPGGTAPLGAEEFGGDPLPTLVAGLVSLLVLPFVAGAVAHVVGDSYLGRDPDFGSSVRAAARRWAALLGAWVLVHLAEGAVVIVGGVVLSVGVAAGVTPLIVLGSIVAALGLIVAVFVMPLFVAVAPAIVIEELGPVRGMWRSYDLLRKRYWPVLGIALLTALLSSLISSALTTVPTFIAFFIGPAGWILLAIGGLLSNLVVVPIVSIISTLLYFDGRIRHEGFDLEVMAADLRRSLA